MNTEYPNPELIPQLQHKPGKHGISDSPFENLARYGGYKIATLEWNSSKQLVASRLLCLSKNQIN